MPPCWLMSPKSPKKSFARKCTGRPAKPRKSTIRLGSGDDNGSMTDPIAFLRIEIKHVEPLIWRRVAVRTSMNLMALHKVIQAAMGWLDYHLWEIVVVDRKYGVPDPDRP